MLKQHLLRSVDYPYMLHSVCLQVRGAIFYFSLSDATSEQRVLGVLNTSMLVALGSS